MESPDKSSAKSANSAQKCSSILSFMSMLMIVALFVRMEAINNKTVKNELRISKVERYMKIMALQARDDEHEMESMRGKNVPIILNRCGFCQVRHQ